MDVALDIAGGVEKISLENLQLQSTLVIQFEFWRKEELATVGICVLCDWRFLSHFDIVSETSYSWKIFIGKQGYVFILTDFKSDVFMFHS